jgi:hypothetical protein
MAFFFIRKGGGNNLKHFNLEQINDGVYVAVRGSGSVGNAGIVDLGVPGHGPVGSADDVNNIKSYILHLTSLVDQVMKDQRSMDALSEIQVPEEFQGWLQDRFFQMNLRFMYERKAQ